jgi:hypothetical protein
MKALILADESFQSRENEELKNFLAQYHYV